MKAARNSLKIVFMGTPDFALPAIRELVASQHEVVAVYTQPPRPAGRGQKETLSPVHSFALAHDIPVYTPVTLKTAEAQAEFAGQGADVAVVVAYGLLLPREVLCAYRYGCINIHPSALPRWRGAAPIQRTIMAGDKTTKIVIMQMDEGLDTGDMLLVEDFAIKDGTTAGELHDALAEKAAPLLLAALSALPEIKPQKQSEHGVTYAKKITKEDQCIDWNMSAAEIRQKILGLSPSLGALFAYAGENIKVFDASVEDAVNAGEVATIIDDNLGVMCGDGKILRLNILQRPNKKRMSAAELLRGFAMTRGTRVENATL